MSFVIENRQAPTCPHGRPMAPHTGCPAEAEGWARGDARRPAPACRGATYPSALDVEVRLQSVRQLGEKEALGHTLKELQKLHESSRKIAPCTGGASGSRSSSTTSSAFAPSPRASKRPHEFPRPHPACLCVALARRNQGYPLTARADACEAERKRRGRGRRDTRSHARMPATPAGRHTHVGEWIARPPWAGKRTRVSPMARSSRCHVAALHGRRNRLHR